ncbi:MAG: sugar nucleotide-binding protein [Ardenticatenaceae bacterium]|nr:sugar nucleotide-binding protein [Ardenticatenaceae bacterium]
MNRILVTGGSSYLGQHLVPFLAAETAVPHTITYTYHQNNPPLPAEGHPLDIRDETAVRDLVHVLQPDTIIHLIGSTGQMATAIRQGSGNVTWAARDVGARLIHLSTDAIFAGNAAPYDETAPPDPITPYGRAKADAEAIVQQHANSVIIRTSLIYGLQAMDHGTRWMAEALASGQPVTLFNNQIRNPIWVNSLCQAILELVEHDYRGILNVAGCQAITRAEFALKLLDYWQIQPRDTLRIAPASGNWPLNCTLRLDRVTAVLQTSLPAIDQVLQQSES